MAVLYAIISPLLTRKVAWIEAGEEDDEWRNELEMEKNMNLRALNDIKFEFASGKINREDYIDLRGHYRLKVAETMGEIEEADRVETESQMSEPPPQQNEEDCNEEPERLDNTNDNSTVSAAMHLHDDKEFEEGAGEDGSRDDDEEYMDEEEYHDDYLVPARDFRKPFLIVTGLLLLLITGLITFTMGKQAAKQGNDQVRRNVDIVQPVERVAGTGKGVSGQAPRIAGLDHAINYLEANPWNVQAHLIVGEYFLDAEEISEAMGHIQDAVQYEPNSVRVLNHLGRTYHKMGEAERAIESLNAALTVDPKDLESLYHLGLIYGYDKGNKEKAAGYFQQIVSSDPDEPLATMVKEELVKLGIMDG